MLVEHREKRKPLSEMRFVLAILVLLSTLLAIPTRIQAEETQKRQPSNADLRNPEWIKDGRRRFIKTCSFCHGTEGEAGKTQSFKTRQDWDPQVIHDTIVNGKTQGSNFMPSWGGSIPDDEVWKVVAYIKSLSAENDTKQ